MLITMRKLAISSGCSDPHVKPMHVFLSSCVKAVDATNAILNYFYIVRMSTGY